MGAPAVMVVMAVVVVTRVMEVAMAVVTGNVASQHLVPQILSKTRQLANQHQWRKRMDATNRAHRVSHASHASRVRRVT